MRLWPVVLALLVAFAASCDAAMLQRGAGVFIGGGAGPEPPPPVAEPQGFQTPNPTNPLVLSTTNIANDTATAATGTVWAIARGHTAFNTGATQARVFALDITAIPGQGWQGGIVGSGSPLESSGQYGQWLGGGAPGIGVQAGGTPQVYNGATTPNAALLPLTTLGLGSASAFQAGATM